MVKSKNARSLLSVLLVIALIAGGVCVAMVLKEKARIQEASDAYEAGDYAGAAAVLTPKDDLWQDANWKAGEKASRQRDYENAIAYFEVLGDAAHEPWLEAKCDLLMSDFDAKNYRDTWTGLTELQKDERNHAYVSTVQVEMLQLLLLSDVIPLPELEFLMAAVPQQNVEGFTQLHYDLGSRWLEEDSSFDTALQKAAEHFRISGRGETGDILLDILDALTLYDYYDATVILRDNSASLSENVTRKLATYIQEEIKGISSPSKSDSLALERSLILLNHIQGNTTEPTSAEAQKNLEAAASKVELEVAERTAVSRYSIGEDWLLSSYDDVKNRCGKEPAGKILFVMKDRIFGTKNHNYAIPMDLMKLLPEERYPVTLEEVEYIIRITTDYSKVGSYTSGTSAIKTTGKVELIRASDGKVLYKSPVKTGGKVPNTIYYYVTPPKFASGSSPNMKEYIMKAYKEAVK